MEEVRKDREGEDNYNGQRRRKKVTWGGGEDDRWAGARDGLAVAGGANKIRWRGEYGVGER